MSTMTAVIEPMERAAAATCGFVYTSGAWIGRQVCFLASETTSLMGRCVQGVATVSSASFRFICTQTHRAADLTGHFCVRSFELSCTAAKFTGEKVAIAAQGMWGLTKSVGAMTTRATIYTAQEAWSLTKVTGSAIAAGTKAVGSATVTATKAVGSATVTATKAVGNTTVSATKAVWAVVLPQIVRGYQFVRSPIGVTGILMFVAFTIGNQALRHRDSENSSTNTALGVTALLTAAIAATYGAQSGAFPNIFG